MIALTASRDSWCSIFSLSHLAQKLVHAFKIPFSHFDLKSKRQRRFSVWPVDGRFCSPFASTDPSISSSSSALPRTSERMEQTEGRRQISNRGTPAHAEKVFHYFQKGLSRFQSRHTWSLFHFFTILYNFSLFFQPETTSKSWVKPHACVPVCALVWTDKHGAASTSQSFCSGVILEWQKEDGGCIKTLLQNNFICQFDGASVKIDASLENAHAFHYSVLTMNKNALLASYRQAEPYLYTHTLSGSWNMMASIWFKPDHNQNTR